MAQWSGGIFETPVHMACSITETPIMAGRAQMRPSVLLMNIAGGKTWNVKSRARVTGMGFTVRLNHLCVPANRA